MFKQKPFPFSFVVLALLVLLHWGGSYFSLYWYFPQFDIVVHIFSGWWVALICLWLAIIFDQLDSIRDYKIKSFLIAFVGAILFGVIWELVENFSQITFVNLSEYSLDTAFDILSDGMGGVLAFLYFIKRKKCLKNIYHVLRPFYNQVETT